MPRDTDKIGRAGEHYVAATLSRYGAYASPFSGNVPDIDVVAMNSRRERVVYIQVKAKREGGNWQVGLDKGWREIVPNPDCLGNGECVRPCSPRLNRPIEGREDHYWVFVSLLRNGGLRFWVVPDDTVRRVLVRDSHLKYLETHGGQRPGKKHNSLHHMITDKNIENWLGRWDVLNLGVSIPVAFVEPRML